MGFWMNRGPAHRASGLPDRVGDVEFLREIDRAANALAALAWQSENEVAVDFARR